MGEMVDEERGEPSYYDTCIGASITAVHEDAESVWLHLSDGSAICFMALEQGFDVEIFDRPPEGMEECRDIQ